jgi:hypothetical protein
LSDLALSERLVDGPEYEDGEPVRIRIRQRGHRYDLDDHGTAWRKAQASGIAALHAAERVVDHEGFNVNRRGIVFVQAVEGRDIDSLATRLASTSRAVYERLLELSD